MIVIEAYIKPSSTLGYIVDETKDFLPLPFCFLHRAEAQEFLDAAERTGINLWYGIPKDELKSLVALWRDASKRGLNAGRISVGH